MDWKDLMVDISDGWAERENLEDINTEFVGDDVGRILAIMVSKFEMAFWI